MMRFMVIVKANKDSEAGKLPEEKVLTKIAKFDDQLVRAGVMVVAEGLEASSKGARVKFEGSKRTVIDGPFAESKELIAGFWIWELKSKDEAIEWLKRAPFQDGEVEIRQLIEAEDFGARLSERRQGEGLVWGAEVGGRAGDGAFPVKAEVSAASPAKRPAAGLRRPWGPRASSTILCLRRTAPRAPSREEAGRPLMEWTPSCHRQRWPVGDRVAGPSARPGDPVCPGGP